MTRTLYLHVGLPKAGSTSIQLALERMATRLGAAGVRVPVAGRWRGNHNDLVSDLMGRPTRSGQGGDPWAALADEIRQRPEPAFVVSAEMLGGEWATHGAARAAALARATGVEVAVLVYARPQWQTLESLYCEWARKGRVSKPFDAFVADPQAGEWLDYGAALRPWRERFATVRVTPLEPSRMPDGLVAHFFATLGLRDAALLRGSRTRSNLRIGAKRLEVLRLAVAARPSTSSRERLALVRRIAPIGAMLPRDAPFAALSTGEIGQVMRRFSVSNRTVARDYGVDPGGRLFRDPYADDRRRPYRPGWDAFTERERRRVREFVWRAAGVDLGVVTDGPPRMRASGPSLVRWSVASRIALHRVTGAARRLAGRGRSRGPGRHSDLRPGGMRKDLAVPDSGAVDGVAGEIPWSR